MRNGSVYRLALWPACAVLALSPRCHGQLLPVDVSLPNTTITSGTVAEQATNSITAANGYTVSGSAAVTFTAGSRINLESGFHATAGSAATTFHAAIGQPLFPITITTVPVTGLALIVDGTGCTSPCTFLWPQGSAHTIGTYASLAGGNAQYEFAGWSDGGALSHPISVFYSTYTANFTVSGSAGVSINPSSGPGPSQFSFRFTGPHGPSTFLSTQMLINWDLNAYSSCYIFYRQDWNELYMATDDALHWIGFVAPGTAGVTLSNSQCTLDVGASSVTTDGTALIVNLSLSFKSSFVGTRSVYTYSVDSLGYWSGWMLLGNYTAYAGPMITFSPSLASFVAAGGQGSVAVQNSGGGNWTAVAGDSWIHLTSPASGTGNGTLTYAVDGNATGEIRTGSISVNGFQFWIEQGPALTFDLAGLPSVLVVQPGNSLRLTIAPTGIPDGSQVCIAPSINPAGQGLTVTVWPPCVSSPSSGLLTITAGSNAPVGAYTLTLASSSPGYATDYETATVNVSAPPIVSSPATQTVGRGGTAGYMLAVNAGAGFSGPVTLAASNLPSGAIATFNPPTLTASGVTALTILSSASSPLGTFPIVITAFGSTSHATTVFLSIIASSPANMISPAPGSTLTGSTATFVWDAGAGISQYQLSLGSSPGASDYYLGTAGLTRTATANLPDSDLPKSVYATLKSLSSGTWQSRSYTYTVAASPGSDPADVSRQAEDESYAVYNNNKPTVVGPFQAFYGGWPVDSGYVSDCSLSNPTIPGTISRPSESTPYDFSSFDVTFTVPPSVAPGIRNMTCTVVRQRVSHPVVEIYDATPHITSVLQSPPDDASGAFYIDVYGTNFGWVGPPLATLSICAEGVTPCDGTADVRVNLDPVEAPGAFWQDDHISARVIPEPSASGVYDIQVTSFGEAGSGFVPAPGGGTSSQSDNRGQVQINPARVAVQIQSADITTDQIVISLSGPPAASGPLTVKLQMQDQDPVTVATSAVGPGNQTVSFGRLNLPIGQYTAVNAQWTVSGTAVQDSKPVSFRTLGETRFTTYNVSYETECSGEQAYAYIFVDYSGSTCYWLPTRLKSSFMQMVATNGTGVAAGNSVVPANSFIKSAPSLGYCPYPTGDPDNPAGGNRNNTFYLVPGLTGSCNRVLMDGTSIATNPFPDKVDAWKCFDSVLLVDSSTGQTDSTKLVHDACPACSTIGEFGTNAPPGSDPAPSTHMDTFSSSKVCDPTSVPDYGNGRTFKAIRLR